MAVFHNRSDIMSTWDWKEKICCGWPLKIFPHTENEDDFIVLVSLKSVGKSFNHMIKIIQLAEVWLCSVTAGWNYSLRVGDNSNNSPKVLIQAQINK